MTSTAQDVSDERDWADETGCVDGPKHDYVYNGSGIWRCRRAGCDAEIWEDQSTNETSR